MSRVNRRRRRRRRNVRDKKSRGYFWCLVILILAAVITGVAAQAGTKLLQGRETKAVRENTALDNPNEEMDDWKVILVNRDNPIPDSYKTEPVKLTNGESVDSRIYDDLQQMIDDARKEGIYAFIASGYRTEEKQRSIMEEKIDSFREQGYSEKEAEEMAETWVAVPGTSEHQTGLAVDINADTSKSASDDVYNWLYENAYRYGFILRYPQDKEKITGTNYEPWHYRYVGKEAAKEIYESGICLEEYMNDRL